MFVNLNSKHFRPTPTPGCIRPCNDGMYILRHSYINNWENNPDN